MGRPGASSLAAEPGREPRFRPNVCRYLRGGLGVVPVHAAARAEPHFPWRRKVLSERAWRRHGPSVGLRLGRGKLRFDWAANSPGTAEPETRHAFLPPGLRTGGGGPFFRGPPGCASPPFGRRSLCSAGAGGAATSGSCHGGLSFGFPGNRRGFRAPGRRLWGMGRRPPRPGAVGDGGTWGGGRRVGTLPVHPLRKLRGPRGVTSPVGGVARRVQRARSQPRGAALPRPRPRGHGPEVTGA